MQTANDYSQLLKKNPVRIFPYDCKKNDRMIGGEVTSHFIKQPSSDRFDPAGLFSEEIFGEIGSQERSFRQGIIRLNTTVFSPFVFIDITRSRRLYKEIMAGNVFAIFDDNINDFIQVQPDDPEADTGFYFFTQHFYKVKWQTENKSLTIIDKVKLINDYKDRLLIDKIIVIPAELREYRIENGRETSDDINKLYLSLLNYSKIDSGRSVQDSSIYDAIRYKIQLKVVEIFEYIKNIISKDGFIEKKYGSRSIAWGTRNVISPNQMSVDNLDSDEILDSDETGVPLFQCMKCFQPLVINKLMSLFFTPIITNEATQIAAIDKQTYELKFIDISEKEKQKFISINGLSDLCNLFKNKELRRNRLSIFDVNKKQYYLYLIYDDGEEIFLTRSKNDFKGMYKDKTGKEFDPQKLRPLTLMEMFYMATYLASYDKHVLITRYPVIGMGSIYPSKVKLYSTSPDRKVTFKSLTSDNDVIFPNYPTRTGSFRDSLKLHPGFLKGLVADHDGDQLNVVGVFTEEANEEIRNHLNSVEFYVGVNKEMMVNATSSYLVEMTLYCATFMED